MSARIEVVVDLDAVRHNVSLLAGLAGGSGASTMVVVKADGYGHGAVEVARAALDAGATWLGVCTLEEAAELRAAAITAPLLSWLHVPDEDMAGAVATGVDLGIASPRDLAAAAGAARSAGRPARVHLKIDTGLSRNGCPPEDWGALVDAVAGLADEGVVEPVAVWSHLAHADAPTHPTLDRQAARLDDAHRATTARLGRPLLTHLANSAATLTRPDLHRDLVRPGVAVYGLDPVDGGSGHDLRPAMTLRSRVALVKTVAAGEGVSYGHTWTTPGRRALALVPAGYADGVPRSLGATGRLAVAIGGIRRPVVGRVCMDQVVVDLGPADEPHGVAEGDEVVLFGPGDGRDAADGGLPTAAEWADLLGTIHYEIVTGVGGRPRLRRVTRGVPEGSRTQHSG
ncbi:alanine racemase [Actinomycetospora endophytica]|uniref:Alanine racemase n=1 Tax=Actinomycetospora endophytica TaxID=2291215 RepID=A0ABS8P2P7_9PSEU|nr:alanine racemase [Actinomycetospora endophytica]MCD2192503.1 alanine racemase [Actinomycetospora endophytica]